MVLDGGKDKEYSHKIYNNFNSDIVYCREKTLTRREEYYCIVYFHNGKTLRCKFEPQPSHTKGLRNNRRYFSAAFISFLQTTTKTFLETLIFICYFVALLLLLCKTILSVGRLACYLYFLNRR